MDVQRNPAPIRTTFLAHERLTHFSLFFPRTSLFYTLHRHSTFQVSIRPIYCLPAFDNTLHRIPFWISRILDYKETIFLRGRYPPSYSYKRRHRVKVMLSVRDPFSRRNHSHIEIFNWASGRRVNSSVLGPRSWRVSSPRSKKRPPSSHLYPCSSLSQSPISKTDYSHDSHPPQSKLPAERS